MFFKKIYILRNNLEDSGNYYYFLDTGILIVMTEKSHEKHQSNLITSLRNTCPSNQYN